MSDDRSQEEREKDIREQQERMTIHRGDLHQIRRGEGPTLAELDEQARREGRIVAGTPESED